MNNNKLVKYIRKVWQWLLSHFISSTDVEPKTTQTALKLRKLNHSCALVALSKVMPELSYNEIEEAFFNCCDVWPRGGVTNKEFNVVLRYLDVFKQFQYLDDDKKIQSMIKNNNHKIILLIPGHFTVLHKNRIYDGYGYEGNIIKDTEVYCAWVRV